MVSASANSVDAAVAGQPPTGAGGELREMGAMSSPVTSGQLSGLRASLHPLLGVQFTSLLLPRMALANIEPSQVGTIVGTLMDALIPHLEGVAEIGLEKHEGLVGEREGYPDYRHARSGLRVELKLLFVDNPDIGMKRPPTVREPSARLTQKVTIKNVVPETDVLLLIAYQLRQAQDREEAVTPTIIDFEVFSMIELVEARDLRLIETGGRWFGDYETPAILSNFGRKKIKQNVAVDSTSYGRKKSEKKDFNEDTNFGKLKRIPHSGLQEFLRRCARITTGVSN